MANRIRPEQLRRVRELFPDVSAPPMLLWKDRDNFIALWLTGRLGGEPDFTGRAALGARRGFLRCDGKAVASNYRHFIRQGFKPFLISIT